MRLFLLFVSCVIRSFSAPCILNQETYKSFNGKNAFGITDLVNLLRHVLSKDPVGSDAATIRESILQCSDYNQDGKRDIIDIIYFLQYMLNKVPPAIHHVRADEYGLGNNLLIFTEAAQQSHEIDIPEYYIRNSLFTYFDQIDRYDDSRIFDHRLKNYKAIVFLHTSGNVLNPTEESYFETYVRDGGSWVGFHSASNTEINPEWSFYTQMIGTKDTGPATFQLQSLRMHVVNTSHPIMQGMPNPWIIQDVFYNFERVPPKDILLKLDTSSCIGCTMGTNHPLAWADHLNSKKARMFYSTIGGHNDQLWNSSTFQRYITNAILWTTKKLA